MVKMDYDFILVGLTSGGPKALYQIIDKFDQSLQTPIIIIQNLPVGFDKIFC
ncbi:MAG: chemotaxis protein CheB, partial [Exilispira sp.]